ncbi:hypothetical protein G166_gp63 [Clostridium phage phi8074-B1]|uniref:hypothetical protein n=1 Tax=Clostridium phage phi8074-B1 TaxID=1147137 RepID=UPI00025C0C72|nr:hypothetical protein G166_gp63 [Clostridium phage phi8074-B1]AFC61995.1 hypothetical protein phi8074-B1_00063 [Clostridium phage phi8074-B1]
MRIEREQLDLTNINSGDVIITNQDCYMVSLDKERLTSLHTGSILTVEQGSILRTINSFGEYVQEIIPNDELVIRRDI